MTDLTQVTVEIRLETIGIPHNLVRAPDNSNLGYQSARFVLARTVLGSGGGLSQAAVWLPGPAGQPFCLQ
jgi:hypothetical protein